GLVHVTALSNDYYRFDPEAKAEQSTRTTDSLLFRAGGTAVPATSGSGFLFDNVNIATSTLLPSVPANGLPNNSYEPTNDFDFTWNASTGIAPLTYEFQSSQNSARTAGVLTTGVWKSSILTSPTIHSSGAANGTWYWQVRSKDANGINSAWSPIWQVTLDNTLPSLPTAALIDANNHGVTNGFIVTKNFTFNLSDTSSDVTHYQLKYWNDMTGSSYKFNNPWNHTISGSVYPDNFTQGEGTHYFAFSACDAAGNCSAYSEPFVVTYDKTAPVAKITSPMSTQLRGNVVVSGTVTDVNPDRYYLVVKNSLGKVVAGPGTVNQANVSNWNWDTTKVTDGDYIIDLEARDKAGNKDNSSVATMRVTVDNTTPIVTFGKPIMNSLTGSVTPVVNSGDATSYLWTAALTNPVELIFTVTDKEPTFAPSAYGDYSFALVATDAAGNTSKAATFSFIYAAPVKPPVALPTAPVAPVAPIVGAAPYATVAPAAVAATTTDGEVLGASTTKQDAPAVAGAETSKDVAVEPTAKDGFNPAWYWLLTIPVVGAAWWALAAFRRRES
ncbi:MAG: Ig-like domain repeat protein, partial [Microcoleus sp.]